ncbi:MAG: L-seryl-tRNA(Sec) selenium transferase [Desulfobacteraceae bacterium 4572_35.2]|nr:MAG: L-seryl-tRNA(Sec) selenium transferase [Desulfobacteraceae bacterium 4572_35.2]
MNKSINDLKKLPSIDSLLLEPQLATVIAPHCLKVEAAQEAVDDCRKQILQGNTPQNGITDVIIVDTIQRLKAKAQPSLREVINATGTLLHTNLGRAPLSEAALQSMNTVARSYSNLELNLETGKRGHRYSHIDTLLCRLTGAEAAAVVNNNAGAVLLALTALAQGDEAIVSRGELVEIGGAFRVPDVMEAGGVLLREVGTTNKTHLRDYKTAINDNTGLLLKIHTSNYRIVGFTDSVPAAEMVALGKQHKIPVMEDLGSGMLFDLTPFGLPKEPTVKEGVAAGIDVLTFSGDKLLGGPQAGLIVGKKWAIDKIRNHPLARALRIDKLTLAALETTLSHYLDEQQALDEIPVLRMLNMSTESLEQRSHDFKEQLQQRVTQSCTVEIISENSCVGGGALPITNLPGTALALTPLQLTPDQLTNRLRSAQQAVVARIQEDRVIINLRTVFPNQEVTLIQTIASSLQQKNN